VKPDAPMIPAVATAHDHTTQCMIIQTVFVRYAFDLAADPRNGCDAAPSSRLADPEGRAALGSRTFVRRVG
jgi:hypothetical protein